MGFGMYRRKVPGTFKELHAAQEHAMTHEYSSKCRIWIGDADDLAPALLNKDALIESIHVAN